jgi:hypothetical protein
MKTAMERRRFRRAELDVPIAIRPMNQDASAEPVIGHIKDISLAGALCYTKAPCALKLGEAVICSVAIPPEQARLFPFARVLGKGWVTRLEPLPVGRREGERQPEEALLGLAVAFSPDIAALGTIEY